MTMLEAVALQPEWVQIWVSILFAVAFILPISLIFWQQSGLAGIVTVGSSFVAGFAMTQLYAMVGYVKLLGLPHIVFWTPAAIFLITQLRRPDMPKVPRFIILVVLSVILISLVFDYTDLALYLLGDRTPLEGTI